MHAATRLKEGKPDLTLASTIRQIVSVWVFETQSNGKGIILCNSKGQTVLHKNTHTYIQTLKSKFKYNILIINYL